MTEGLDIDHLRTWIGRTAMATDEVTLAPLLGLAATLDSSAAPYVSGDAIPACWHWLYFLPFHPRSEIGPDGHLQRGGFLPPVPLPRRMWASSQIEFLQSLSLGQKLVRRSTIEDVRLKEGRTGPLIFVTVLHQIDADGAAAIHERHHIVYRDMPAPDEPTPSGTPAPTDAQWSRRIVPDDVLLFRYSALTFNAHRIHYDRRYATGVERYPGLVVHCP